MKPVQACPPSAWYRFRKFVRRQKRQIGMAGVAAVALLVIAGSVGWVLSDRAAQQAYAEREAAEALDDAGEWCERGLWPQAQTKLRRAETVLGDRGSPPLRSRLGRLRANVQIMERVEEIRLWRANNIVEGNQFDNAGSINDYRKAFEAYGLPVLELEHGEAAERVRASAIREALLAALDDWAATEPEGSPNQAQLFAVAQGADDDTWRQQCRAAIQSKDPRALARLAGQPDVLKQGPPPWCCWATGWPCTTRLRR